MVANSGRKANKRMGWSDTVEYAELLVNLKELESAAIELSILPPKWRGMRGECALLSLPMASEKAVKGGRRLGEWPERGRRRRIKIIYYPDFI
jgi:hypothetical protein